MTKNFYVECISTGYFTYGNISYIGQPGAKIGLACANKIMGENIVVYARNPLVDSPLPIPISSESEMLSILSSATAESVGSVYKYTGVTTETFEKDSLYIISKE